MTRRSSCGTRRRARKRAALKGHTEGVTKVAYSPNGKTLASASGDKTIRLWDAAAGEERAALEGRTGVLSLAFSPDGKTLASGSADDTIKFWDAATGKERAALKGQVAHPVSLTFSPDGKTLACVDKTIKLFDAATGEELVTVIPSAGHKDAVSSLAFSPDGKSLASASYDDSIIVWDVKSSK